MDLPVSESADLAAALLASLDGEPDAEPPAEAVFLIGLPDIAESRPHSKVNSDREIGLIG